MTKLAMRDFGKCAIRADFEPGSWLVGFVHYPGALELNFGPLCVGFFW